MKHCAHCDRDLPATVKHFGRNRDTRDGLGRWCRDCHAAQVRAWARQHREAQSHEIGFQERRTITEAEFDGVAHPDCRCPRCLVGDLHFGTNGEGKAVEWCPDCGHAALVGPALSRAA